MKLGLLLLLSAISPPDAVDGQRFFGGRRNQFFREFQAPVVWQQPATQIGPLWAQNFAPQWPSTGFVAQGNNFVVQGNMPGMVAAPAGPEPLAPQPSPMEVAQARAVLQAAPAIAFTRLNQLSPNVHQAIRVIHQNYVSDPIRGVNWAHTEWHRMQSPDKITLAHGGTLGPGSGENFLNYHRRLVRAFIRELGLSSLPSWSTAEGFFPAELSIDPFYAARYGQSSSSAFYQRPSFLTRAGGLVPGTNIWVSLAQIQSLDELGRAMAYFYHVEPHRQFGGAMARFDASVFHPAFWWWHGEMDALVDEWAALTGNASPNPIDGADYSNPIPGVACNTPLCQELARRDQLRIAPQ